MTLDPKRLWAKSEPKDGTVHPPMHLLRHLQDVYAAAERVLDATADDQLRALGLEPSEYGDRFRRCVRLAAAVHDLGKANDHFQGMIRRTRDVRVNPQGLRHEWVTVLILQELKAWLLPAVGGSEPDFAIVEWAVAGHHPAMDHPSPPRTCPPGAGAQIVFRTQGADFTDLLGWLETALQLPGDRPAVSPGPHPLVGVGNVYSRLARWERDAQERWSKLKTTPNSRLLAAVKNTLVAADVAGSALPREGTPDWNHITTAFRAIPSADDLTFLANYGLEGHDPRPFQTEVAEHPDDVVFVKAGCGTGKTVAAYLRAANKWRGKRLYFCYPTTGTATEGFKDYLHPEVPEKKADDTPEKEAERKRLEAINADLFHSRSGVDFDIILTTGGDSKSVDADAAAKADALEMWSTPVVACTVDTVLGIVQNNKKGLFGWPALAQSAFVFDEIHAYDDRLFGALLRFLRDVPGLPCLLMTASLPTPRQDALTEVLKKFRNIDLTPIPGPEGLEKLARYHREEVPEDELLKRIKAEVDGGGKVLWVSNTVKRVMTSAEAAEAAGLEPLIYHSRFKYEDRVKQHLKVSNAFKPEHREGVLACTSQVCEMSLDLKGCTLLVTEAAPVPALIQRLGRLNRHAKNGDPTRPFVVLTPENNLPYTPAELQAAEEWLAKLPDADISQRMLADAWEQNSDNPPDLVPSAWLDGGPLTTVTELREASPGITVILRKDAEPILAYQARIARERRTAREQKRPFDKALLEVQPGECHPKDIGRYTIPMNPPPRNFNWREWKKLSGHMPIAEVDAIHPEEDYTPTGGAKWKTK